LGGWLPEINSTVIVWNTSNRRKLRIFMVRNVQLTVISKDTGYRLDMPAVFEDHEIALLEEYLECADALLALAVVQQGVPCSFEISVRDGAIAYVNVEIPPAADLSALLHRLRPFILSGERTSYSTCPVFWEKYSNTTMSDNC
jgi:hypothetical protein